MPSAYRRTVGAMITITGHADGEPCTITWDDGQLGGPPAVVELVEHFASTRAELHLPPVGPTFTAGLEPAWRAAQTIIVVIAGDTITADAGEDLEVPGAELEPGDVA